MDKHHITSAPSVIVLMPTYNHEKYIAQAIDSILNQVTDFDVFLYISDDASTDSTFDITKSFANRNRVKVILNRNEYNLGAMMNGALMRNIASKAGNKYIALCEGDDYWTDPLKLQKQVDIMENDNSVILSFHNANEIIGDKKKRMVSGYTTGFISPITVVSKKIRIPTLSMLFKKTLKLDNDLIMRLRSGDRYIELAAAMAGKIYYIDELMGEKSTLQTGMLGKWKQNQRESNIAKYKSNILLLSIVQNPLKKYMHRYLFKVSIQILKLTKFSELRFLPLAIKHFMLGL